MCGQIQQEQRHGVSNEPLTLRDATAADDEGSARRHHRHVVYRSLVTFVRRPLPSILHRALDAD